jgi:hypothetical protein
MNRSIIKYLNLSEENTSWLNKIKKHAENSIPKKKVSKKIDKVGIAIKDYLKGPLKNIADTRKRYGL